MAGFLEELPKMEIPSEADISKDYQKFSWSVVHYRGGVGGAHSTSYCSTEGFISSWILIYPQSNGFSNQYVQLFSLVNVLV